MRLMRILSVLRVERTVTAWRLVVTVFKRKGDELMVRVYPHNTRRLNTTHKDAHIHTDTDTETQTDRHTHAIIF